MIAFSVEINHHIIDCNKLDKAKFRNPLLRIRKYIMVVKWLGYLCQVHTIVNKRHGKLVRSGILSLFFGVISLGEYKLLAYIGYF